MPGSLKFLGTNCRCPGDSPNVSRHERLEARGACVKSARSMEASYAQGASVERMIQKSSPGRKLTARDKTDSGALVTRGAALALLGGSDRMVISLFLSSPASFPSSPAWAARALPALWCFWRSLGARATTDENFR